METGYVKFFDTREGKLFGFLVDEMGDELFFHYSNGRAVQISTPTYGPMKDEKIVDLVDPKSPLRYPKKGDRLMYIRGRNTKGPKAAAWCYQSDYDDKLDKSKRNLTLDEATKILESSSAKVLEYVKTTSDWGSQKVVSTTKITWRDSADRRIATGEFVIAMRHYSGSRSAELISQMAVVNVYSPDSKKYLDTRFQFEEANALKQLGRERQVESGVYESVMWNGGSDHYVVDPRQIRDITALERKQLEGGFPEIGGWLRCMFAPQFGNKDQMVKVLAHLGGHE